MKTLSIQEPYATLILNGYKKIETRSWKTNYRGEILIHASVSKEFIKTIDNSYVLDLIKDMSLNYGKIVCQAKIIDCIEMTDEYIEKAKLNKQEYALGIYKPKRYAWILDDIKPLKEPIDAKGKLGLWDYKK